jgi:predicted kinase
MQARLFKSPSSYPPSKTNIVAFAGLMPKMKPALPRDASMEGVILIGIQGSGKSTFCRQRLFDTHVRINLDMLRTRHREETLLKTCIALQQSFVVDNTNPTREERAKYIVAAREAGFQVTGYYFASKVDDCKQRNEQRDPQQTVPLIGLLGTYKKLQLPDAKEGFDRLYYVTIVDGNAFAISEWLNEV